MPSDSLKQRITHLLDQPMMGFVPWIAVAVIEGPHRVLPAYAVALGIAVVTIAAGFAVGVKPKLLDQAAAGFFTVMLIVAAVAGPGTTRWLGDWSGELSSVLIAVITTGSLMVRTPFTIQYARETTEPEYWTSPVFLRINYIISGVWAATFLASAAIGYIGTGPLHDPNNVWTNWLIPIGLLILAIKFTAWYPAYATVDHPHGPGAGQHRHPAEILRPLTIYLIPAGILVLIVSSRLWWLGLALIVAGPVTRRTLRQATQATDPH